jgi:hypothetical protein
VSKSLYEMKKELLYSTHIHPKKLKAYSNSTRRKMTKTFLRMEKIKNTQTTRA